MDQHFNRESINYMLSFNQPIKESELLNISRLEGVELIEGYFTLPIRVYQEAGVRKTYWWAFTLQHLKHPTREDGTFIPIPQEGMLISRRSAERLGLKVGDTVELETLLGLGPNRYAQLKIVSINYQLFGKDPMSPGSSQPDYT